MIDACAFDAIESADVFDEMVLFSGRYFSTFNDWAWCPDDKCDIAMDYQNWRNDSTSSGNCMGAYLNDNVFGDYGWVKRDCSDTLVRVLCRLDCAGGTDSPVTDETTTVVTTTQELTSSWPKTQRLMYTVGQTNSYEYGTVYDYVIDDVQGPVKIGAYQMPYTASQPSLVYNYALSVLEIIGDYFVTASIEHYFMDITGYFTRSSQTLFTADAYSTLVYSENVGTICIGGLYGKQNVYIVHRDKRWGHDVTFVEFILKVIDLSYYFWCCTGRKTIRNRLLLDSINFGTFRILNINDSQGSPLVQKYKLRKRVVGRPPLIPLILSLKTRTGQKSIILKNT